MNDVTREILKKISERKTLDSIAKELDIGKPTLHARVDSLIRQGYLGEITYGGECKMCPIKCSSTSCNSNIKMFSLTKKSIKLIENI